MKPVIKNMNNLLRSAIANVILAFVAAGCGNDAEVLPVDIGEVPLQIVNASVSDGTETRAMVELRAGKIGVFRVADNGYSEINNSLYEYLNKVWTPKGGAPMWVAGYPMKLFAYYPFIEGQGINKTITRVDTPDSAKDFWYATTGGDNITALNPKATFNLKQAYSRLHFVIDAAGDYPGLDNGKAEVQGIKFTSMSRSKFTDSHVLNISNDQTSSVVEVDNVEILRYGQITSNFFVQYQLMVPPQEIGSGGLYVAITIDGKVMSVIVPTDANSAIKGRLEGGKIYKMKFMMSSNMAISADVYVEDYTWGGVLDEDEDDGYM